MPIVVDELVSEPGSVCVCFSHSSVILQMKNSGKPKPAEVDSHKMDTHS